MSSGSVRREQAVEELKEMLAGCSKAIWFPFRHQLEPLMTLMNERLARAVHDGIPLLVSTGSRWAAFSEVPEGRGTLSFLTGVLEDEAAQSEDAAMRWLLVAYGVLLGDFDTVCRNLEPVAASDLGEVPWLVAAALWVQWGSGQVVAHQLKEVLLRIRAANPGFDAHVKSLSVQPQEGLREAAGVIVSLLTSPSPVLPEPLFSRGTE